MRIIVNLSPALSSALATLTDALDRDGIDLATQLQELAANLRRASLGMTITISDSGDKVTFSAANLVATSPDEPSALMRSSSGLSTDPGSSSVRRESTVEVYIDIAADSRDWAGIDTTASGRDNAAMALGAGPGLASTLQRCSAINRAIGVLLERRRTPETAHEELAGLAHFGHTDLYHAAEYLLRDLAGDHPTGEGAPAAA